MTECSESSRFDGTLRAGISRGAALVGYYWRSLVGSLHPNRTDPWCRLWIDPHAIEWTLYDTPTHGAESDVGFDRWTDSGRVVGGDWDCGLTVRFEEMPKCRAAKRRFIEGVPWEDTELFEHLVERIDERGHFDGCETRAELRDRYSRIDRLYEQIRSDGYESRDTLCSEWDVSCRLDVPKVHIGRDGTFIYAGGSGYHRTAIGRVLGIPIEVRVVVRHAEWQELRESVARGITVDEMSERARRHVEAEHPDLASVY